MSLSQAEPNALLSALRETLNARAAGWWRVADGRLEQVAFVAASDMPVGVSHGFAEATRSVGLDQSDLSIVQAATTGLLTAFKAEERPAGTGSGLWLRRFGAGVSVAVPIRGLDGEVAWVVSVALEDGQSDPRAVGAVIGESAADWSLA